MALRWDEQLLDGEHLYGFDGAFLVAQALHTDTLGGRHWRAFLAHQQIDGVRYATADEATRAAEVAWQSSGGTRSGSRPDSRGARGTGRC